MEQLPYIRLFGRVGLSFGTASAERFSTTKCHELVAFLTLARGRDINRDAVCRALWPDEPVSVSCRNRLSVTSYLLRKECQGRGIPIGVFLRSDRMTLGMSGDVRSDYADFVAAAKAMQQAEDPETRAEHARRILALYRGPLADTVRAPWLTVLRSEARRTFHEAVVTVAKTQSMEESAETLRQAALVDLDAEGSVRTVLHVLMERRAWAEAEDILSRLEDLPSTRSRRVAAEFRKSFDAARTNSELALDDRPLLTVCMVDQAGQQSLRQIKPAHGPKREDFVLLANPLAGQSAAQVILGSTPRARVSLHLVVMDPDEDVPAHVREEHARAMAGRLHLSEGSATVIEETTQAQNGATSARTPAS